MLRIFSLEYGPLFSNIPLHHAKHMLAKYSCFFNYRTPKSLALYYILQTQHFKNFNPSMRMKFGKRLQQQIQQSFPGWRDKFLAYKELKKLVKLISLAPSMLNKSSKTEAEFLHLLDYEIEKFNTFFMEQEEDFIIHHKELQQKIKEVVDIGWGANANGSPALEMEEQMEKIRKAIVNFHGEMVLLLNYSNINYTGLSKILKKYDKRTGGVLRLPFIQKVLEQPFFTTDSISKLVKECETTIDAVFPPANATGIFHSQAGNTAVLVAGEDIFRNTVSALLTMQEIRRGSSTYNHFSLPPLSLPDSKIIQSLIVLSPIQIPS